MNETQLMGSIETATEGVKPAILNWERDHPNEATISLWGFPDQREILILVGCKEDSEGCIELRPKTVLIKRPDTGLLPMELDDHTRALLLSIRALLRKKGPKLLGRWLDGAGTARSIAFGPLETDEAADVPAVCGTWEEFKEWASKVRDEHSAIWFRGHGNSEFKLQTTFHRMKKTNLHVFLSETLTQFHAHAEAVTGLRIDRNDSLDFSLLLGLAQHHGLPTPLLDWTASPYVAAFFAFADAIENMPVRQGVKSVRVYALTRAFVEENSPPMVQLSKVGAFISTLAVSPRLNPRLYAQQGSFLVSNIVDVEGHIRNLELDVKTPYLKAIDIPISEASKALEDLSFMGLNAATLFPGLDGVCRMLKHAMSFKKPSVKPPGLPSDGSLETFPAEGSKAER